MNLFIFMILIGIILIFCFSIMRTAGQADKRMEAFHDLYFSGEEEKLCRSDPMIEKQESKKSRAVTLKES